MGSINNLSKVKFVYSDDILILRSLDWGVIASYLFEDLTSSIKSNSIFVNLSSYESSILWLRRLNVLSEIIGVIMSGVVAIIDRWGKVND